MFSFTFIDRCTIKRTPLYLIPLKGAYYYTNNTNKIKKTYPASCASCARMIDNKLLFCRKSQTAG